MPGSRVGSEMRLNPFIGTSRGLFLALLAGTSAACGHTYPAGQYHSSPGEAAALVSYDAEEMAQSVASAQPASEDVLYASAPSATASRARAEGGVPLAPTKPATAPALPVPEDPSQVASDAVQVGPLLVYSASFVLSVYEVEKTQQALKQRVKELGGFVSAQTDARLTVRVPAAQFEQTLLAIEAAGKVRSRNVQAADVGDEYRDATLRLHTAELLRQRLEAMLAQAVNVSDALEVQAQIERIVREIEQLKGQLRGLNDRIAYSTVQIMFQPEIRPDLDDSDVFKLPFPWLDELGLHHLLELAP